MAKACEVVPGEMSIAGHGELMLDVQTTCAQEKADCERTCSEFGMEVSASTCDTLSTGAKSTCQCSSSSSKTITGGSSSSQTITGGSSSSIVSGGAVGAAGGWGALTAEHDCETSKLECKIMCETFGAKAEVNTCDSAGAKCTCGSSCAVGVAGAVQMDACSDGEAQCTEQCKALGKEMRGSSCSAGHFGTKVHCSCAAVALSFDWEAKCKE